MPSLGRSASPPGRKKPQLEAKTEPDRCREAGERAYWRVPEPDPCSRSRRRAGQESRSPWLRTGGAMRPGTGATRSRRSVSSEASMARTHPLRSQGWRLSPQARGWVREQGSEPLFQVSPSFLSFDASQALPPGSLARLSLRLEDRSRFGDRCRRGFLGLVGQESRQTAPLLGFGVETSAELAHSVLLSCQHLT